MKGNRMRVCQTLLVCLMLLGLSPAAWAKWYLLASVHPNNLVVIDTETDTVVRNIALEGRGPALNIAPNPAHPQYAYVVNNLSQSVAMVDLDEGKQVTSFPLSSDTELVRTMAIDVNAQGNRLFIHEMPLQKEQGSYTALDNRIRVNRSRYPADAAHLSRSPPGDVAGHLQRRYAAVHLQRRPRIFLCTIPKPDSGSTACRC